MKSKNTFLSLVVLIIAVVVGWWFFHLDNSETPFLEPFATSTEPIVEVGVDGWTTYTDDEIGFAIQYPSDWYFEQNTKGVFFTPLAPENPKRASSIGLASSLSVTTIDSESFSEIQGLATIEEPIEINGYGGSLLLTPNAYAGGSNSHYVFPLATNLYLQIRFYGEADSQSLPFRSIVETLQVFRRD